MGAGQTEHHVTGRFWQTEQQTAQIGCDGLAKCAKEGYQEDNPQHVWPLKQRSDIDQHAYTNQEVGDEQCVADKLDAVHQR